ncbi:universal stress protein UspA [Streptomyces glebosus]|uniref:Universal stress protein UspA n=2 Tax=Streptomyces glebosus TaxID=249580 RepID=A0A640T0R1_9ACTN|nr:universal stress protein UspA [Streptomyces glebosus]
MAPALRASQLSQLPDQVNRRSPFAPPQEDVLAETPMAGHEIPEPADRKQVADAMADLEAAEKTRHSCDPAFRHGVVVGFDGSMSSERALAYAIGMARRLGSGLIIVHVANRLPTTVWAGCEPPVFVDVPDHRTEVLGLELACADHLTEVPWILVERGGDICHELEEVGREYEADAIVVGSTHGIVGRIFGSVAGRLARRAQRPVIVIP